MGFGLASGHSQNIRLDYGPTRIALNEAFTISIELEGEPIEQLGNFPDIEGFKKLRDFVSSTSTSNFEGKTVTHYIKTKVYHPSREGSFRLPNFSLLINGKNYDFEGISIQVGPFDEKKGELLDLTYQDLFLREENQELVSRQEQAFLGLIINKTEVFVGEGFNAMLAFYVAEENQAPMKFWELGRQVEMLARQLKPKNCWEENFEISELGEPLRMEINGRIYFQFLLYQASFFPLNTEPVRFPSVTLRLRVQNQFRPQAHPDQPEDSLMIFKDFVSNAQMVNVKELPPHPLRDRIAVGNYYLDESALYRQQRTGQAFSYEFRILGEGNISAIHEPVLYANAEFEIYPPIIQQYINRGQNRVSGRKIFKYQLLPKVAGRFELAPYFEWVFFNPVTQRYDTLRPRMDAQVVGADMQNSGLLAWNQHPLYGRLLREDSTPFTPGKPQPWQRGLEIALFVLLVATLYLVYRGA
ncbi:MAG: BatD family protein [Microscillaceae bacterium]